MPIPTQHQAVMPYLIIPNASKFIEFAQTVFGASLSNKKMREAGNKIRHAEININGSTIMFSDASEDWPRQTTGLFIYMEDVDGTYQKAIDQGAKTIMEISNQDYGRACGVEDPFGTIWWITSVPG